MPFPCFPLIFPSTSAILPYSGLYADFLRDIPCFEPLFANGPRFRAFPRVYRRLKAKPLSSSLFARFIAASRRIFRRFRRHVLFPALFRLSAVNTVISAYSMPFSAFCVLSALLSPFCRHCSAFCRYYEPSRHTDAVCAVIPLFTVFAQKKERRRSLRFVFPPFRRFLAFPGNFPALKAKASYSAYFGLMRPFIPRCAVQRLM